MALVAKAKDKKKIMNCSGVGISKLIQKYVIYTKSTADYIKMFIQSVL